MSLKKVTKKLSAVRDSIKENGAVTVEDEKALKELVRETLALSNQSRAPKTPKMPTMPKAHNDNKPLTPDQRYRLSLIEKTGTGSTEIH